MTIPTPTTMNNNSSSAAAKVEQFRRCELCQELAAVYCSSDEARLCWQCDSKVHAANFLVSRHSRSLLCRRCRSPTAWSASGPRLPSMAFSLCDRCCRSRNCVQEVNHRVLDTDDAEEIGENDEDDDEEEYEEIEDDDDDDIDDGENQVVPWSPAKLSMPVAIMSSSDEEHEPQYYGLNSKRTRDELKFEEDHGSSSSFESEVSIAAGGSSSDEFRDYRPSKRGHFD